MMSKRLLAVGLAAVALVAVSAVRLPKPSTAQSASSAAMDTAVSDNAKQLLDEGRRVFRYETFGDEAYWGDTLKLHRAIAGRRLAASDLV
jgi:hypothetical protein